MQIYRVDAHICRLLESLMHTLPKLFCRFSRKSVGVVQIGKPHAVGGLVVADCCGVRRFRRAGCGAACHVQLLYLLDVLGQVVAKGGVFRYVVFGLYRAAAEGNQQKKSEKSCDLVCHMCVTSENSENIAKKLVEIQRITEKKKSPCIAL